MQKLEFRNIKIEDGVHFCKKQKAISYEYGWEYLYAMTWIWNDPKDTMIAFTEDCNYIKCNFGDMTIFFPPYVKNIDYTPKAFEAIDNYCMENNIELLIRGVPKELAERIDTSKYSVEPMRDGFDYIYRTENLINLSGKKYHSKRNFLSRFRQTYPQAIYREYAESDKEQIVSLYKKWVKASNVSDDDPENFALSRVLQFHQELKLDFKVIEIDGQIKAFYVASESCSKVGHVLLEKADSDIVGIYVAINNLSATSLAPCEFINRQEDMGIVGLRKAKESYYPEFLLEKYEVKKI